MRAHPYPVSRRTPFPSGGELPKRYSHTHDPFVALSFAAAATKKLMIGTGICLVPQHDPIVTAKSVASLDQLSGGRFVFGIGGGWNVDEMENHGARYDTRFKLMRERVLAMKALWTQEVAGIPRRVREFRSGLVVPQAEAAAASADPAGRRDRLTRCGASSNIATAGSRARAAASSRRARSDPPCGAWPRAGRDPATLSITVFSAPSNDAALAAYEKAGIQSALLAVPDGRDEILRHLDKLAPLAAAA